MTVEDYFNEERQKLDLEDKISKSFLEFLKNNVYSLLNDDQYLVIISTKNSDDYIFKIRRRYSNNRIESHYLNDMLDFDPKHKDNYPVLLTVMQDNSTFWDLLPHDVCKKEIVLHVNSKDTPVIKEAIKRSFELFSQDEEWSPVKVEFPGENGEMIDFRTVELTEKQKNIELDF